MYSGHDIEKQQLTAPLTGSSPYQAAPLGAQPKQPERPAQSSGFRDPIFLLLFVGTVVAMCGVAFTKGVDAVTDAASSSDTDGSTTISAGNKKAMGVIAILCACSVVLSGMILSFLMKNAESLIRTSLYINIFLTGLFAIVAFVNNQIWVALVCVLFTAINYCYMRAVQRRIPFASANLKVACAAIRDHFSVVFVSYLAVLKGVFWSTVVILVSFYAYKANELDDDDEAQYNDDGTEKTVSDNFGTAMFFIMLAMYWGQEVIKNISHVTTAGTVASWWYDPSRTNVVSGSYCRATTTSLGSIAFGSLIVAVIQMLKEMASSAERRGEGNIFTCIARCILQCIQNIVEYFNRWAFVYVGVYGDSFIASGKAVFALFKNRGWTALINDNLIQRVLLFMALTVGCITGGIGALIPVITGDWLNEVNSDVATLQYTFAAVGFLIGLCLTMIMVSVIDSAVATVFVCLAEAPNVLESTHPAYFYDLTAAWRECHSIVF
ncbi:hypothetical protein TrLO_g14583 [Triparma laevis f. longispina]|uniref:Choline transporter-like protein n=1 Tax=Triparma laevis f. longispina TaxID=1714387 RepID=A0A9W7E396_9STRA|nr:hypothetical protein TrLO_g14583 [Triparma laevis f. longispina]